ncbi:MULTISPECIES: hypothetical protein [unclassified Microcoleus]|uniref:hypothetical protein n=1 Tax=unclassified Microcoleus TaxID=2642155 RepID=UPI002FD0DDF3
MTPEESKILQEHLQAAAAILLKNTPKEQLKDFASIELAVRDHVLKEVAPEMGNFFVSATAKQEQGDKEGFKPVWEYGKSVRNFRQKLGLKKRTRLSRQLEASCLLLSANVSYANAARDLKQLTGIYIDHSTQQRLVHRQEFVEVIAEQTVTDLSIDGGKARLRTDQGKASEWRDYKAVTLHKQAHAALFLENQARLDWVNRQPLSETITCLGDGHPGVWN